MLLLRAMPASPRRISPPWLPPPPTAVRPVNCVFGWGGGLNDGDGFDNNTGTAHARLEETTYRRRQRRLGEEPAVARLAQVPSVQARAARRPVSDFGQPSIVRWWCGFGAPTMCEQCTTHRSICNHTNTRTVASSLPPRRHQRGRHRPPGHTRPPVRCAGKGTSVRRCNVLCVEMSACVQNHQKQIHKPQQHHHQTPKTHRQYPRR